MANDHYIPQFLTRPWEFGERKLRFFDFLTRDFENEPAKRLFARHGLNPTHLEAWLNRNIETPVGAYAAALRRNHIAAAPRDWPTQRALALFFILGAQRIEEGRSNEREDISLEVVAQSSDAHADAIAHYVLQRYTLAVLDSPTDLFFTEAMSFAYPMPERPVIMIPLGLWHVLAAYDGPIASHDLVSNISKATLSMFSIGVGSNVHRVILPAGWRDASIQDPSRIRGDLLAIREGAVNIFNLVGTASRRGGMTGDVTTL